MTLFQKIRRSIEEYLNSGMEEGREFIIYPFGEFGLETKRVLNECFGIQEGLIIDNNFCKTNNRIQSIEILNKIDVSRYVVLFTAANPDVRTVLKESILKYFPEQEVIEVFSTQVDSEALVQENHETQFPETRCGKYTFNLCNHWLIEEIGAFSTITLGTEILQAHPTDLISTHPFVYYDKDDNSVLGEYESFSDEKWFFPGVKPKGKVDKLRRITIGNDVWIAKNVIIVNGANIGNGAIVAAGAVVTKDVPDYAVVAGVPARIIRYRYTPEQIEKLNAIAWWDWSDEKIRECHNDFYLDIEDFLEKHYDSLQKPSTGKAKSRFGRTEDAVRCIRRTH